MSNLDTNTLIEFGTSHQNTVNALKPHNEPDLTEAIRHVERAFDTIVADTPHHTTLANGIEGQNYSINYEEDCAVMDIFVRDDMYRYIMEYPDIEVVGSL